MHFDDAGITVFTDDFHVNTRRSRQIPSGLLATNCIQILLEASSFVCKTNEHLDIECAIIKVSN